MRRIMHIIALCAALLLSSCDVHELPVLPEDVKLHLRLNYETEMTEWNFKYSDGDVIEQSYGKTYGNQQDNGTIRYIIRTYPISEKMRGISDYVQEFVITKDISEGYNHEVTLDLLPGKYNVMVWSDLVRSNGDSYYHDAGNFAEICLQGEHKGNDDYRDAFRGSGKIGLIADIKVQQPDTLDIEMQRPLAKFEFITNDVVEFIDRETAAISKKDTETKTVNIEDYKVVFYYVGFMPDTYSMNTDKPVDSSTGVLFESSLKKLSENKASLGFDYVFVNGKESSVTVQIGLYNNSGELISLTQAIKVPLTRNHHTKVTGKFLMSKASGGVSINPDFDGEYNLIIP